MDKLMPCPKCKKSSHGYKAVGDWKQYLVVQCIHCGYIAARHDDAAHTRCGARRIWNRRESDE